MYVKNEYAYQVSSDKCILPNMNILRCPFGFISNVVGMNIFKENIQESYLCQKIWKKTKSNNKSNATKNGFCMLIYFFYTLWNFKFLVNEFLSHWFPISNLTKKISAGRIWDVHSDEKLLINLCGLKLNKNVIFYKNII